MIAIKSLSPFTGPGIAYSEPQAPHIVIDRDDQATLHIKDVRREDEGTYKIEYILKLDGTVVVEQRVNLTVLGKFLSVHKLWKWRFLTNNLSFSFFLYISSYFGQSYESKVHVNLATASKNIKYIRPPLSHKALLKREHNRPVPILDADQKRLRLWRGEYHTFIDN